MEDLSSLKTKYPDVEKVNIEIFCKIFNAGVAAGRKKETSRVFTKVEKTTIKKEWNKDPEIRLMWLHNFKAFLAFWEFCVAGGLNVVSKNGRKL